MRMAWVFAAASCATWVCAVAGSATQPAASTVKLAAAPRVASPPPPKHWDVLGKYCTECHNTADWAGGIAFDALSADDIATDSETWEKAIRKLETGMMPPPGKPRPPRT